MALQSAPKGHAWAFVGSMVGSPSVGDTPLLVAVCSKCGLIRAEVAGPRRDSKIDLSGTCTS
jgi:hypothetical protein